MKHYTLSFLRTLTITLPAFLLLSITQAGCFQPNTNAFSLYQECKEYYDSRGFYHKECPNEEFSTKDAFKTYKEVLENVQPGKGVEDNKTKESKIASTIDEIIEDKTKDDVPIGKENNKVESNTPALREKPSLEFGREE